MPDPNLAAQVLTVAMWIVVAACVLGTAVCLHRMRRPAQHLDHTPNTAPIDNDHHHRTSKEN